MTGQGTLREYYSIYTVKIVILKITYFENITLFDFIFKIFKIKTYLL